MTILSSISTAMLTKLAEEAGTNDFWTATELKSWFNDLYLDICREHQIVAARTTTTDSEDGVQNYALTSGHLQLHGVTYDGEPLTPTTIIELNAWDRNWRSGSEGTPRHYFFEEGLRYSYVSLFPTPGTDGVEVGLAESYIPDTLDDDDEPAEPFADGLIIRDGVLSLALAKEGEGQNIERSEFYWTMFATKLRGILIKPSTPEKVHRLRSIEDAGVGGLNLGEHYPSYPR